MLPFLSRFMTTNMYYNNNNKGLYFNLLQMAMLKLYIFFSQRPIFKAK